VIDGAERDRSIWSVNLRVAAFFRVDGDQRAIDAETQTRPRPRSDGTALALFASLPLKHACVERLNVLPPDRRLRTL
jgi:hypothetical protein